MANEQRGERNITVGGQDMTFRLSAQACNAFKAETGVSVLGLGAKLQDDPDEALVFTLMFHGLQAAAPAMTRAEFDAAVTLEDLAAFIASLSGIMQTAFGTSGNATAGTATS